MVINADTRRQPVPPADRSRERLADYTALKVALQAEVLDWNDLQASRWAKRLAKIGGKGVALAALAYTRRKRYQAFYCDSENNALVLALALKLSRARIPLVTITHWLTPSKKVRLFRYLKIHSHITKILLHSSVQHDKARQIGIPVSKLELLPYQVDTEFWKAEHARPEPAGRPYIFTAGLEFRDYPTLLEALEGLDIDLKIGAASLWSKRKAGMNAAELPPRVEVKSYNYNELRDAYAGSRLVVVPLQDVDFQAGITVILEAMAMGKAVIVSRSEGQGDTIADRRHQTRGSVSRPSRGHFVSLFGEPGIEIEQTGMYVSCGDAKELRQAIRYLLDHPEEADRMGQAGRRVVENLMSIEKFADRIRRILLQVA